MCNCKKRKARYYVESNIAGDVAHKAVDIVDAKTEAALEAVAALEDVAVQAGQSGLTVIDKTADNLIIEAQEIRARLIELGHKLADVVGKREEASE